MRKTQVAQAAAAAATAGRGNEAQATIVAIMGASGSGKTFNLKRKLAKLPMRQQRRTIVWSPKEKADNYAGLFPGSVVVRSAAEVLAIVRKAGKAGGFHIVFEPRLNRQVDAAQFGAVCSMALAVGNVTFIADELHTVTTASWAPDGWSQLVMMGRAYGCAVFGLSQRPASIDKDFFSNCTVIRTGRLAFDADCKAVAKALNVKAAEVLALTGYMSIERDTLTGKMTRA